MEADTAVIVQQSDTNIAVIKASADSEAVVTTGAASAHADAPMHQCTDAPMHQHQCTMHQCTNTPTPTPTLPLALALALPLSLVPVSLPVPPGTASANAAKRRIEADSGALRLLKEDLLTNNAQVLQYLWSQTLRDDTHSKLLVGLDSNPAIIST